MPICAASIARRRLALALAQRRLRLLAPRDVGDGDHGADHATVVARCGDDASRRRPRASHRGAGVGSPRPRWSRPFCARSRSVRVSSRRCGGTIEVSVSRTSLSFQPKSRSAAGFHMRITVSRVARDDANGAASMTRTQPLVAVARARFQFLRERELRGQALGRAAREPRSLRCASATPRGRSRREEASCPGPLRVPRGRGTAATARAPAPGRTARATGGRRRSRAPRSRASAATSSPACPRSRSPTRRTASRKRAPRSRRQPLKVVDAHAARCRAASR